MKASILVLIAVVAAVLLSLPGASQPPAQAAAPTLAIKVDQVGYLINAPKVALVVADSPASDFTVRRASDNRAVFSAKLSAAVNDKDTGDKVQAADFSGLKQAGRYYIEAPGVGRSWEFSIDSNVYSRAFYLAMRGFYGQRCGIAVDLGPEFPGYKHAACHLVGAWHASSGKSGPRVSAKGWHDAGDYGRYVVNSGITTGTLLWTYEMFPGQVKNVKLNIPETGNGTPDILNEIKWNLDWMLSMQDEDGGVWQKQTSEQFCGFIMPEKDTLVSYVIGTGQEPIKSSCATGDFAAVMAIAGRVYKPFQPRYAAECLRAAQKAYAWLEKNPSVRFNNPPGVGTGAYGDGNCSDERLWAAAELYRSTGDDVYQKYFLERYRDFERSGRGARGGGGGGSNNAGAAPALIHASNPQSWGNVSNLALWTYVLGKGKDAAAYNGIRDASLRAADEIVARAAAAGYRNTMTSGDYVWGSNGVAANYGMQLLVANAFKPDPRYADAAMDNLHYILGRNTFSISWVTQLGANPFKHPHHRPSGADDNVDPWPGLMSGGPASRRQDPAMNKLLPAAYPPARGYLDEQESYASNEVAINWQAPLVFVLGGVLK